MRDCRDCKYNLVSKEGDNRRTMICKQGHVRPWKEMIVEECHAYEAAEVSSAKCPKCGLVLLNI